MGDLIPVIAIACFAGVVHGLTGFGFGVVAMPLMLIVLPYRETVAIVAVLGLAVFSVSYFKHRAHHSIRNGLGFIAASVLGVVIGAIVTSILSEQLLVRILGATMVVIAVSEFLPATRRWGERDTFWAYPLGVASGILSGAFNMGGPLAVVYLYRLPWPKEQIAAVLQVVFGVTGVVRVLALWQTGLLERVPPSVIGCSILPSIVGLLVGIWAFGHIPKRYLRPAVFAGIGFLGLKYVFLG